MKPVFEITEEQREAIGEILNIAIGQAGRALSEMVDETVTLSAPVITLMHPKDAGEALRDRAGELACAVKESFEGPFKGDAFLIFPEDKSLQLIRHLIGEDSDLDHFTEMEQDALTELGNVILTSCTVTFADTFGVAMKEVTLPEIIQGRTDHLLTEGSGDDEGCILYLEVDFGIQSFDISAILLIVLGIADAQKLIGYLDGYADGLSSA